MGKMFERSSGEVEKLREFTSALLRDVHALEQMLDRGMIESQVRRIGAEQEMALVDDSWRPSPVADSVLAELDDPHFTTEIARFNLECNLEPMTFAGDALRRMERELDRYLEAARAAAAKHGSGIVLAGILPSIRKTDLTLENMTPRERYHRLNDALTRLRGSHYQLDIVGSDELNVTHDNVMLEACNTSFQLHFQVDADEFATMYNIAQAVTGPVLAAAVNSPLLGRYRLWHETRIALFQQSLDTRTGPHERDLQPRVSFGTRWLDSSVLEIYQEDIARFKVLMSVDSVTDPFELLADGRTPGLEALCLHNGTVYRWNRACYGVGGGKPHLRIENRVLPAGPSVLDEVGNAAFWFGLMAGLKDRYRDITEVMEFDDARDNFAAAARHGLNARFTWVEGRKVDAKTLILDVLLPSARDGMIERGIDRADVDRYLRVVRERVEREMTGSQWMLKSLASMRGKGTRWEQVHALVASAASRQLTGKPVHEWPLARLEEAGGWKKNYLKIGQLMKTDLFTVSPDEPIDLVANLMVWHRVRHIMVEDGEHNLHGVVSHRKLLRLVGRSIPQSEGKSEPVSEIMIADPVTVTPETLTVDAIRIMREKRISCLPVVDEGKLVGAITEDDFMDLAGTLLEEKLEE
ncbi:MAG: Glutamate--cysteine ligase [Calditrichaeota bacterium]|nr:Glutamate--cysteine ligase [Calditrichota bacterium]